nr:hypothetical protein Itr_chr11CG23140 [Ipomoea trifida]
MNGIGAGGRVHNSMIPFLCIVPFCFVRLFFFFGENQNSKQFFFNLWNHEIGLSHANRANKATEFKTIIEELHVKSAINRREQRTEKAVTLKRFSSKLVWNSELTE